MKCDSPTKVNNGIQVYVSAGRIQAGDNAIAMLNTGTSNATINGYTIIPGSYISMGGHECDEDCTQYLLNFSASTGNSLTVFRGRSAINFGTVFGTSSSTPSTVRITDTTGNSITATAGSLNVADAATLAELQTIDTDLLAFKAANHTDLVSINTALSVIQGYLTDLGFSVGRSSVNSYLLLRDNIQPDIATIKTEITTLDTDLLAFKSANHTDLVSLATKLDTLITLLSGAGANVNIVSPVNGSGFVEVHVNP